MNLNSSKNTALVVLALAAFVGAVLAWKQYAELTELRAAALGGGEREQLKKRALAAETHARALETELAAAQGKLKETQAIAKTGGPKRTDDGGAGGPLRGLMGNAANLINRPEMQKVMALTAKAGLDARYAPLFKQLGIAPEKIDQLKQLMVERQAVSQDVFAAALQQGLDPMQNRREIAKLTADAQAKVDDDIKSLLGDTGYANYQNYQATLPQRSLVNQLGQALSYTANPLSDTQQEQLVQILAANQPQRPAGTTSTQMMVGTRTMSVSGGSGSGGSGGQVAYVTSGDASVMAPGGLAMLPGALNSPITDSAVNASRSVLSDPQVAALLQIQQQQAQLRAAMQAAGTASGQSGTAVIQVHSSMTTDSAAPAPAASTGDGKPPGGE